MSPDIVELTSSAIQNMTPNQGVKKKKEKKTDSELAKISDSKTHSAQKQSLNVFFFFLKHGSKMIYDDSTEKDTN